MKKYVPRIYSSLIEEKLQYISCLILDGAKATGKTTLARKFAASEILLDEQEDLKTILALDPSSYLSGKYPRLIDEWQLGPSLWNKIRRIVDEGDEQIKFILTGSAFPSDEITRHSGAGRISRIRVRPMTLHEKGLTENKISLSSLFENKDFNHGHGRDFLIDDIVECLCIGGWPGTLRLNLKQSQSFVKDYLEEIIRTDLPRLENMSRNPNRIKQLVRSIARNIATEANLKTITAVVSSNAGISIKSETIQKYLEYLERLMITDNIQAWSPNLRSKSRIRQSPKHHFVDPSLAIAALGASASQIRNDFNLLGLLFESLVARELRVFLTVKGGQIYHYRDNTGLEVDYILESDGGVWAGVEVKLGRAMVDDAAKALKRLKNKVAQPPAFLAVIVPGGICYQREDKIFVIGLNSLGP